MRQQTAALLFVAATMFLSIGCAGDGPKGLPHGAVVVAEGSGPLVFTAPDKGALYVRDSRADKTLLQSPVDKGQRIEVDPIGNRVTLDGRQLNTTAPLDPKVSYQIYMKLAEQREYHPMMNP
jgi:hypothetical protein